MPDYGSYTAPVAGSSTGRSAKIVSQTQFHLATFDQTKLSEVVKKIPVDLIYAKLQQGQVQAAADLLCVEKSTTTLATTSGVATEPTGFYRAKQIQLATGLTLQLVELSVEDYDLLIRNLLGSTEQTPQYFKRWGGSMTFYPAPADGNHTMFYYGTPTTTASSTVSPETPEYLDDLLLFYVIKEMAPVAGRLDLIPVYEQKFQAEMNDAMRRFRRTKTQALMIAPDVYA